jgi:hypothetical protein
MHHLDAESGTALDTQAVKHQNSSIVTFLHQEGSLYPSGHDRTHPNMAY